MASKDMQHKDVSEELADYFQWRNVCSAHGPIPIGVGNHEEGDFTCYTPKLHYQGDSQGPWGTDDEVWPRQERHEWEDPLSYEASQMQPSWKGDPLRARARDGT